MNVLESYNLKTRKTFKLVPEKKRQKITIKQNLDEVQTEYQCYNCNKLVQLSKSSVVICPKCFCRIVVKLPEKTSKQYSCV
jgi:DNA-directed RNA polymerase subunit RPC12/RpoP